ncbi:uncharacterized protein BO80DRAFT_491422 [Aspergillus ibericus CBS 121593]|uniref:Uncharacterized protein n=1 Tax=Aspergillus ibericus CBS 121593 TaxID=1448316 RepID=A0A395HBA8_9EURO|nr:hypothetical protein BO80DRAFT_491422 [Aspergillus ibericus CBS 121593]RAL04218.1 hypothetical protein BO80DRAFT_491422 [Aspergillus ibericus CBS 121593]
MLPLRLNPCRAMGLSPWRLLCCYRVDENPQCGRSFAAFGCSVTLGAETAFAMSSNSSENGDESPESSPSSPRSPSEPPLESEPSVRSSRVRPYFDLSTIDTFYELIVHQDDGRIRLYPPFFEYDDQDAWSRGQHDCKHDVLLREYAIDECETCDSCGNVPTLGWFYRCGVDISGYSHQMDPGQDPVVSPWIADAMKVGCYDSTQKEILEQQKLKVVQVATQHRISQLVAFPVTGVIYGIDPDDDDDNPHVEIIEDVSEQDHNPPALERSANSLVAPPPCSYRACHDCAPRLQERVWLSINEICRDSTVRAPTQWDLRDQSISDARVVSNLGLRPSSVPLPDVSRHSHAPTERMILSSPDFSATPSIGPSTTPIAGSSALPSDGRTKPYRGGLRRLIRKSFTSRSLKAPSSLTLSTSILAPITTQVAGAITGFFSKSNPVAPPPPPHREIPGRLSTRPAASSEPSANPTASSSQTAPSSSSSEQMPSGWPRPLTYQTAWNSINKHPKRPNLPNRVKRTIVWFPPTIYEEREEEYREPESDDDDDDESGGCPLDPEPPTKDKGKRRA